MKYFYFKILYLFVFLNPAILFCQEKTIAISLSGDTTYFDDTPVTMRSISSGTLIVVNEKGLNLIEVEIDEYLYHGKYLSKFDNGQIEEECFYYYLRKDSSYHSYFQNGQIRIKGLYNKGNRIGYWNKYYENGNKAISGFYNDLGEREGDWRFYYESGNISSTCSYKRGLLDGLMVNYSPQGDTLSQGNWNYGNRVGDWFIGDKGDNVGHYNELGQRDGKWVHYQLSGKKEKEGSYKGGIKEGKWKFYDLEGRLNLTGSYRKNLRSGIWTIYSDEELSSSTFIKYKKGVVKKIYQ